MTEDLRMAANHPSYPRQGTFADLLFWHLYIWGTRPNGPPKVWDDYEFRKKLFGEKADDQNRLVYGWLGSGSPPGKANLQEIIKIIFGDDPIYRNWIIDLRVASKDSRGKNGVNNINSLRRPEPLRHRYSNQAKILPSISPSLERLRLAPSQPNQPENKPEPHTNSGENSSKTAPVVLAENGHLAANARAGISVINDGRDIVVDTVDEAAIRSTKTSKNLEGVSSPQNGSFLFLLSSDERTTLFAIVASGQRLNESHLRGLLKVRGVECAEQLVAKGIIKQGLTYTLASGASETVLEWLCQLISDEIQDRNPDLLVKAPLLDTREPEAAIQSRTEEVVLHVLEVLKARGLRSHEVVERIEAMLIAARSEVYHDSYLAGNLVNLLAYERRSLAGTDLSKLILKHAYLRGAELRSADLRFTRLESCVFADIFGSIWQVGFRNGDKEVLASSVSGTVRSWSVGNWANKETYGGHGDSHFGWSFGFSVSCDGQEIASAGGDAEIRIWRADGKLLEVLSGHSSRVRFVAFCPDGSIISCSEDCRVMHWERRFGVPTKPIELYRHHNRATTLALSPDARLLMTGASGGEIVLFDLNNRKELNRSYLHRKEVRVVRISDDGVTALSGADDGQVLIWKIVPGEVIGNTPAEYVLPIKAACFIGSSNRMIATGNDGGEIAIWQEPFSEPLYKWPAHKSLIRSLATSSDGSMIVSGGDDQTVMVWQLHADFSAPTLLRSFSGYSAEARAVAFSQETMATAHDDGIVRFWNPKTGKETTPYSLEGHKGRIWSIAFYQAGRMLITGAEDGKVRAWRLGNKQPFWIGSEHDYRVFAVTTRDKPTPRIVSGGSDSTIKIWSINQSSSLYTIAGENGHSGRVRDVAFSHDGRLLCSVGEDKRVLLWTEIGSVWQRIADQTDTSPVTSTRFSADDREIFCGTDAGRLVAWRHASNETRSIRLSQKPILSIAVSPDGEVLAAGFEDGHIQVIDARSFRQLWKHQAHRDWVEQVEFSPDGSIIASCSDDQFIRLWDRATFDEKVLPIKARPPYAGLRIHGVSGIDQIEKERLRALGAVDNPED